MRFAFFFMFLSTNLYTFAQLKTDKKIIHPGTLSPTTPLPARNVLESVFYPTFGDECAVDLVTIGLDGGWGRVSGMNFFGDLEKAQRMEFTGSENYTIVGALVFFETPRIVGNGLLNCKIYSVDQSSGGPGVLKGFSDGVKVDQIIPPDSMARATPFTFESGVEVKLDDPRFFVSVSFENLYSSQDTVVLLQTIPECGDGTNTWELFADGTTWVPISSSLSWELNSDFIIVAIVDFNDPTNIGLINNHDLSLQPASPNPASNNITINYILDNKAPVRISIYHPNGQKIRSIAYHQQAPGVHQETMDLRGFEPSLYFYTIETDSGRVGSRFVVGSEK